MTKSRHKVHSLSLSTHTNTHTHTYLKHFFQMNWKMQNLTQTSSVKLASLWAKERGRKKNDLATGPPMSPHHLCSLMGVDLAMGVDSAIASAYSGGGEGVGDLLSRLSCSGVGEWEVGSFFWFSGLFAAELSGVESSFWRGKNRGTSPLSPLKCEWGPDC